MMWQLIIWMNVIAVIISITLILYYKRKWKGIKHYEKIRDELTLREDESEEEVEEEDIGSGSLIGSLLGGFIVVIVGLNIIPTVMTEVANVSNTTELGGATESILGVLPIFFAIGIIVSGLSLAIGALRQSGLLFGDDDGEYVKNKFDGIKHYEKTRDKMTKKKPRKKR